MIRWLEDIGWKRERVIDMRTADKPPYRIPLMAEIRAVPLNGYNVVSTFSGCGGSCLGYRMAGFNVLWASEFEPNAAENYRLNFPDSFLDTRDIRAVRPEEVLDAIGKKPGEIDLLDGSPPCQSFSTAGKRSKHWGKVVAHGDGTTQRSDDLFLEYARILRGLQPRTFVAENVSGLVKGVAKGYFKLILAELKSCDYLVEARLLDAQWLGVPQMRQRLIFVGVRNDLAGKFGAKPEFPRPLPYRYSVMEAIGDLLRESEKPSPTITAHQCADTGFNPPPKVEITQDPHRRFAVQKNNGNKPLFSIKAGSSSHISIRVRHGLRFGREKWMGADKSPAQTVGAGPSSGNNFNNNANTLSIEKYAIGREWDKLRPGEQSKKYFNLVKPDPKDPCPAITASGGGDSIASVVHPTEKRKFTIAELRRICAFPDDFTLVGSYAKQWARLGNSVPPPMMRSVAEIVRDKILAKIG